MWINCANDYFYLAQSGYPDGAACGPSGCGPVRNDGYGIGCGPSGCGPLRPPY